MFCAGHKDSVTCAKFSNDSVYVVTGDMSGLLKVWKVSTRQEVWTFEVGDLEVSPGPDWSCATCGACASWAIDKIAGFAAENPEWWILLQYKWCKLSESEFVSGAGFQWVEWHHGAHILLAGTAAGDCWMWKIPAGDTKTFQGHGCGCSTGAVLPDGGLVYYLWSAVLWGSQSTTRYIRSPFILFSSMSCTTVYCGWSSFTCMLSWGTLS